MISDQIFADLANGQVPSERVGEIEVFLSQHWDSLSGSSEEGMRSEKIGGRTEAMTWERPVLRFLIERHGVTVNGSKRADTQQWTVDFGKKSAHLTRTSKRQLIPNEKRLDIKRIAEDAAKAILAGKQEEFLIWKNSDLAIVKIEDLVPETNKQTTSARRRRLLTALEEILKQRGWNVELKGRYTYAARSLTN